MDQEDKGGIIYPHIPGHEEVNTKERIKMLRRFQVTTSNNWHIEVKFNSVVLDRDCQYGPNQSGISTGRTLILRERVAHLDDRPTKVR